MTDTPSAERAFQTLNRPNITSPAGIAVVPPPRLAEYSEVTFPDCFRKKSAAFLLAGFALVDADHPLSPAPPGAVTVEGAFRGPRIDSNAKFALPLNLRFMESSGWLANFDRAAGLDAPPHVGNADSAPDVFKVLEGAARTLRHSHLLYSAGHLYEAGVAWCDATGRKDLLETSTRYADLIDLRFGHGKIRDAPGHQQIELALVKLHRSTGERRYLDLSRFFPEQRGHIHGGSYILRGLKPKRADYNHDRIPLAQATSAVGHAVRAGSTYAAMTDIAEMCDHGGFRAALDHICRDVVDRKPYLTGGSATAQYYDEGFGEAYHLPNETACRETCGNIATVLWSHRMALLHGDAEYVDVLERSLHNGVLSGISLAGDRFFYTNRLATRVGILPVARPTSCERFRKWYRWHTRLARTWKPGDAVLLDLPMPVRRVLANQCVEANRGRGHMDMWLARSLDEATPLAAATAVNDAVASASGAAPKAKLSALNDGRWEPRADDRSMPRFTWSADGSGERWVQFDW